MSGGTLGHDQIMGNLFDLLRSQLRGKDCRVFTNNMQIKVPAALSNIPKLMLNGGA